LILAKVEISEARLKSLLAAEAFAQAARIAIVDTGNMNNAYPHFDRWMRYSCSTIKYGKPTKLYPVWCCSCKKRHIAGCCVNE